MMGNGRANNIKRSFTLLSTVAGVFINTRIITTMILCIQYACRAEVPLVAFEFEAVNYGVAAVVIFAVRRRLIKLCVRNECDPFFENVGGKDGQRGRNFSVD